MGLEFVVANGGTRLDDYEPQPVLLETAVEEEAEDGEPDVKLDCEVPAENWSPRATRLQDGWRAEAWEERPVHFVDGKDVGRTIAWMRSSTGHPIPVRLSQIGAVVMRVEDGVCLRQFSVVERVVSLIADPFPWEQVEGFAAELQSHDIRLLLASPPDGKLSYDFEPMRKATQNRSNTEMAELENIAVSRVADAPGIVDGRLEPRSGGLNRLTSPIFGVVKTHFKNYLHALGMQVLYQLETGERTPIFALPNERLPVASWYYRLSGGRATPNWGIVRVEVSYSWLNARYSAPAEQTEFANQLSCLIHHYRCTESSYGRAAVSLHPIVRAEESLGSLFAPLNMLTQQFYHLTGL